MIPSARSVLLANHMELEKQASFLEIAPRTKV
jgi:hypothetical protein